MFPCAAICLPMQGADARAPRSRSLSGSASTLTSSLNPRIALISINPSIACASFL